MKMLSLALAFTITFAGQSDAAIILEFFQGTSVNDTVLSLTPFPNDTVTLVPGGPRQFVQMALRQTAPTALLDANDGLAAYLLQGVYGPNQSGNWVVPASVAGGTTPVANSADYTVVRLYRIGPNGNMSGGNENTATAFRFGGLNFNPVPPPSPTVDANGRLFLGTFALQSPASAIETFSSSIIFQDPEPNPTNISFITDMGDYIDPVLFNGNTYPLGITVVPEPTSLLLTSLVVGGVVGLRWRRKGTAAAINSHPS